MARSLPASVHPRPPSALVFLAPEGTETLPHWREGYDYLQEILVGGGLIRGRQQYQGLVNTEFARG